MGRMFENCHKSILIKKKTTTAAVFKTTFLLKSETIEIKQ